MPLQFPVHAVDSRFSSGGRLFGRWLGRWADSCGVDAFLRRSLCPVSASTAAALVPSEELLCARCGLCRSACMTQMPAGSLASTSVAQESLLCAGVTLLCSFMWLLVTGRVMLFFRRSLICVVAIAFAVCLALQFGAHLLVRDPAAALGA